MSKGHVDATAGEAFLSLIIADATALIEKMVANQSWGEEHKQQKGMHTMKETDMLAAKIDLLLSRLNERAHEKEAMSATVQAIDDEDIAMLDTPTPWSSPSCNSFPTQLPRRPRIQQTRRHCFGHNFVIRHQNGPFLDALERGRQRRRFGSSPSPRRSVDHFG